MSRDVLESIRRKANTYYGVETEEGEVVSEEPKTSSYEEAKLTGNVTEMLKHKSGYYEKIQQEKELNTLLDNTDIVAVTHELKGLDGKIEEQKAVMERAVEKAKEQIKVEYEEKIRQHRVGGGMRGGMQEALIQSDYYKAIESVESKGNIRILQEKLAEMQNRRAMLTYAKDKYVEVNKELIAEERKRQVLENIRKAGLV